MVIRLWVRCNIRRFPLLFRLVNKSCFAMCMMGFVVFFNEKMPGLLCVYGKRGIFATIVRLMCGGTMLKGIF